MAQFNIQIREDDKLEVVWNSSLPEGFPVIRLGGSSIYPPGYGGEAIDWLKELVRQASLVIEQFEVDLIIKEEELTDDKRTTTKSNSSILE